MCLECVYSLLKYFGSNFAGLMRLCLLLEVACRCPVLSGKAINCREKGFQSQPWCMMGQHGPPPFLNISLKWPQGKNKYCYMATSHLMGTFDYNH